MENLKEEVKSTLREINSMHEESYYEEKANELINLFNKEKSKFAFEVGNKIKSIDEGFMESLIGMPSEYIELVSKVIKLRDDLETLCSELQSQEEKNG